MDLLNINSLSFEDNTLIVQLLILLILIITLVFYVIQTKSLKKQTKIQREQTEIQNSLYKAQVFRDRFDMFQKSEELISEKHVEDFKRFPEDYIDLSKKDGYDENRIYKYMYFHKKYEYLLFVYELKHHLNIDDPLKDDWEKETFKFLAKDECDDFHAIREINKSYYPDFEKYLFDEFGKLPENDSLQENSIEKVV